MEVEYECCESGFFVHIFIVIGLVTFSGLMSGLTLGLMSLSLVDLEVLARSGTPNNRKHAEKILPVVKKQHLLLVTLLLCNAGAMEALPVFLGKLVTAWGAILISVTLILLFGEIMPQSICSRYGLAIGAKVAPVVQLLLWICFPIAYPISKLLDRLLGHGHTALFRRSELKTLVNLHGNEAGKGGELTHDETTIIAGALELTEKKASDAMTPISETFAIDINAKLDRDLMKQVLDRGHSRIPVYYEQPANIIGLILVKNLVGIQSADEVPVKNVTIRKIPRVPENMPLYGILNEFQKGHSHMAVVVKPCVPSDQAVIDIGYDLDELRAVFAGYGPTDVKLKLDSDKPNQKNAKSIGTPQIFKTPASGAQNSIRRARSRKWTKDVDSDVLKIEEMPPKLNEEEVVGIITMEDVIEELLQEEIFDETDHHEEQH